MFRSGGCRFFQQFTGFRSGQFVLSVCFQLFDQADISVRRVRRVAVVVSVCGCGAQHGKRCGRTDFRQGVINRLVGAFIVAYPGDQSRFDAFVVDARVACGLSQRVFIACPGNDRLGDRRFGFRRSVRNERSQRGAAQPLIADQTGQDVDALFFAALLQQADVERLDFGIVAFFQSADNPVDELFARLFTVGARNEGRPAGQRVADRNVVRIVEHGYQHVHALCSGRNQIVHQPVVFGFVRGRHQTQRIRYFGFPRAVRIGLCRQVAAGQREQRKKN